MIQLETDRLIIRDHKEEDLPQLHSLLTDTEAMYYLQDLQTRSLEGTMKNLETSIAQANAEDRKKFFFAIEEKIPNQYLGEIGFTVLENRMGERIVDLGYFILPRFWRRGYVTEAAKKVIGFAFEHQNVHKIVTGCISDNSTSENIMKKCGMRKEADFKKHVWHDGQWKDRVEYGLLREEWRLRK